MIGLGIDFHLIATCGNIFKKLFYKRIIPDFIEQAGTIAGRIIVHLVRMPHYIETAQLQHTPQPSIIQTHHPLQVTSELLIHNPLEGSGGNIHIHNLRFIIIQHVYGTDAVVQRKFPETINGRITLFIQIIYFQTKIKFYLPSIFLFHPMKFRQIVIHTIPFHCPRRRKRQRGMR